jgi:NAD(P)-dependent dehydrogenase (short-subunit alcohol dehydrogenase family)
MDLADKVALVTGGRRMGHAIAERLASLGVDVALSYNRSGELAEEAAGRVRGAGRAAIAVKADLRRVTDVHRLVEETAAQLGRLDMVINMASVYRQTSFDELTDGDWTATLEVDLFAAWRLARAGIPHLREAGGGHIVNFSDWIAASGRPRYAGYLPYYVAKRAVIGLTEALALEVAGDGILVNAIAPGPMVPPTDLDASEIRAVERATPIGRWGGASAVADTVVALLKSDFITGETIRVDGGRHLR